MISDLILCSKRGSDCFGRKSGEGNVGHDNHRQKHLQCRREGKRAVLLCVTESTSQNRLAMMAGCTSSKR